MAKRNLPLGGAIPMEAGERTLRVTVYARPEADAVDAGGHPAETWSVLLSAWMRKEDLKGSERLAANQLTGPKVTRWEMGYTAEMDPEQVNVPKLRRLGWQGRLYDITDASMIGHREGIEIITVTANQPVP